MFRGPGRRRLAPARIARPGRVKGSASERRHQWKPSLWPERLVV